MARDTKKARKYICDAYKAGKTVKEIRKVVHLKEKTIEEILCENGLSKKGLDVPKIWALHNAGWSVPEIVWELSYRFPPYVIQEVLDGRITTATV